jgi:hypothetical protein
MVDGKVHRGQVTRLPVESWKACLHDRHAAYISWEEWVANQEKLESNRNVRRQGGAPRKGPALLQGLVLCGRCGYRMTVQQGGYAIARYVCAAPVLHSVSMKLCWSVSSRVIDEEVSRVFLDTAQPPEIELSLAVAREVERQAGELERQWTARLDRARYEAQLAERRYKAVDPDNRVVARTLESDWEAKLRELEHLDEDYRRSRQAQKVELTDADRSQILSLARDLPRVWSARTTTNAQRKNLLRLLVEQVTLTPIDLPRRATRIQLLWRTGAVTESVVERPRHPGPPAAPATTVELIGHRIAEGWSDRGIAEELNSRGITTPKGLQWNKQSVRGLRKRQQIRSRRAPPPGEFWPTERSDGLLSTRGVAERFGVTARTVRTWIDGGLLQPADGGGRGRPSWFSLDRETESRLVAASRRVLEARRVGEGGEV